MSLVAGTLAALAALEAAWVVQVPVANMHARPSEEAGVVSQALYGVTVSALEQASGWVRVRTPDDYTGWISEASLWRRQEGPYAVSGRVATITSLFANLYQEPDITRRRPLLTVAFETRLELEAADELPAPGERWVRVRLVDGRAAWVQRGDVSLNERPLAIDETIALARRFVGLPYLWGGTSTYGFDCSGFMQMLGRRRGVLMPRDSAPQSRWEGSEPVAPQDLRPGDLLYFGDTPEKVNHTGMYIGGGEFIHATSHGRPMVQISRLDEAPWNERLVGCRRLKTAGGK